MFSFTSEDLSPYMQVITKCLLNLLITQNKMNLKQSPNKHSASDRKLVRITLALLHKLCNDSDNCKKLIMQSQTIEPLVNKWIECREKHYPEADLILSLLKTLGLFIEAQQVFLEEGGARLLNELVLTNDAVLHNNAATILYSIGNNR